MNKILLISSLIVSLYAFTGKEAHGLSSSQENHVKISVIEPKKADMDIPIEVRGITEEVAKHIINAPFNGIVHMKVVDTQKVNKGDVIAIIENKTLKNQQDTLKNNLSLYREQLTIETKKLQSSHAMLKMGLISINDYLAQQSLVTDKKIVISNMTNKLHDLNHLISKRVIRASVTGYISDLQTDNSYLSYANPICKITSSKVHIRLFIPVLYAQSLRIGQNVVFQVGAALVKAHISQILPNTSHNLIEAIAQTMTPLQNGLSIEARIQVKNIRGWILPKECIVLIQNRPAIFIIKKGLAHVHFVDVRKDMVDKVLVTDDLKRQDQIAYKNAYMLQGNSIVEVVK